MEWMATAAFLGVLYCTVLGVFKKFRVSMNFSKGATQSTSREVISAAVYRPFRDTFDDNFTTEVTNSSTSATYPGVKREEQPETIPSVKPQGSNINNVKSNLGVHVVSNGLSVANTSSSKTNDKTISGSKTNINSDDKVKTKEKEEKLMKEKMKKENDKKLKSKEGKESKEKKKKGKAPSKPVASTTIDEESVASTQAEKLKKEEKLMKEKLKKENDKKLKSKEGKESKEKKKKGKAPSKPVASTTIDEESVASNQAEMRNPMSSFQGTPKNPAVRKGQSPPSYEEDIFSKNTKNLLGNPKNGQINTPTKEIGEPKGFTSSWDQVAQHRVNMQRELKSINAPATNLRAMANQGTRNEKEINNLFLTSVSSPRNNNPPPQANMNRRFSDFSSGQESDTEA